MSAFYASLTYINQSIKLVYMGLNMLTQQIGAFEAKTHFSQILEKIENGGDFIITKRGKPVAKIIPFKEEKMSRKEAINALREMRKLYNGKPGEFNIREAIEDGRKY